MRRHAVHLLALLLGAALAVALAACGSDADRSALIPPGDAEALEQRIDAVAAALDDGECDTLGEDLSRLRGALVQLPDTLDPRLRDELERGVENVVSRAPQECEEPTETQTVETVTTQTPTETTETETTPPTTTTAIPTTTTPVEPTTPADPGGVEPPTIEPPPVDDGTGGVTPDVEVVP